MTKSRFLRLTRMLAASSIVVAASAHASPITIYFTGTLSSEFNYATGAYDSSRIGTAFSGSYTLDTANADPALSQSGSTVDVAAANTGCGYTYQGACAFDYGAHTPVVSKVTLELPFGHYVLDAASASSSDALFSTVSRQTGFTNSEQVNLDRVSDVYTVNADSSVTQTLRSTTAYIGVSSNQAIFTDVHDLEGLPDLGAASRAIISFADYGYIAEQYCPAGSTCVPLLITPGHLGMGAFAIEGNLDWMGYTLPAEVPEPGTFALAVAGLLGLVAGRRRRIR